MIIFLLYLAQACDTVQYLANITSYASFLPMSEIQQQLNIQFQLPNINGNTSIQNIIVNPKSLKYNISQNGDTTYTIVYDISYIVTFLEFYSGIYLQGQALIYNSQVTIIMNYELAWQQQGILQYSQPQQISQIGLQQYSTSYTNVSNLLNQQLPILIGDYYNGLTLSFEIQPSIYDYTYKNVSGSTVTIPLNITISSGSYSNGLNLSRLFFVQGYDNNNCTELSVSIQSTYYQLEIYSLSSLQSIFNYAQSKGYFNAILDEQFKTAEFQFIVGSFQNVIKGLTGQYPIQTTMYGYCETSNPQLIFNQTQYFFANLPYLCSIYNPLNSFSNPMVQINFTLAMNLTLVFIDSQIIVKSGTPKYFNKTYVTGANLLQRLQLGNLFFDSVIARQFDNTYIFGSGFPTLSRTNPQYTIQNDYLMIYDNLLSNQ